MGYGRKLRIFFIPFLSSYSHLQNIPCSAMFNGTRSRRRKFTQRLFSLSPHLCPAPFFLDENLRGPGFTVPPARCRRPSTNASAAACPSASAWCLVSSFTPREEGGFHRLPGNPGGGGTKPQASSWLDCAARGGARPTCTPGFMTPGFARTSRSR